MRDQKPVRPVPVQQELPGAGAIEEKNGIERAAEAKPARPRPVGYKPLRPESPMHADVQTRKNRGRLNRETLSKLGKVLEAYFDDVRNQGVPDRFKLLLQQFDDRKEDDRRIEDREDQSKGSS